MTLASLVAAENLNLTDEQSTALQEIVQTFQDRMADNLEKNRGAQREFEDLVNTGKEDPRLDALPGIIGKLAEDRASITLTAVRQACRLVDAGQWKSIRKLFQPPRRGRMRSPRPMGTGPVGMDPMDRGPRGMGTGPGGPGSSGLGRTPPGRTGPGGRRPGSRDQGEGTPLDPPTLQPLEAFPGPTTATGPEHGGD